ncbi:Cloacin immunity protein [Pseudomonas sp. GM102]|uniref:colicin E3-like toxin immunity protein n=1 Tax=Pseudomonas sp. GM102 TaxID=1144321 RepID=UPI00026FC57A|nr:colicin E3-like toxin immunity protein [Pseudomonas sp. GM102]EJM07312.1 Cloacin immunity protein [Pseudomonas sp. GM102]
MGLRIRLHWFDEATDIEKGKEYSRDLGEDGSVMKALGLPIEETVNNGLFDVTQAWLPTLQPYFGHQIDLSTFNYQIGFSYREQW